MRILLDTHVFLWWLADDPQLSANAREVIEDADNELLLSAASGWEIAIKTRLGKLKLPGEPQEYVATQMLSNSIDVLPIAMYHALHVYSLPAFHRDPFDRMLVAQSQAEQIPILTADSQISQYAVKTIR